MRPHIICHMVTSLDGGLHPSRWTKSPDGDRSKWSGLYEDIHKTFGSQGWMVGRVTMAEMSKAEPHPPTAPFDVTRPLNVADRNAASFAICVDTHGKVHFSKADLDGDHVVVLLGDSVSDAHLAELKADGISYIVSERQDIDLATMMEKLSREFGIKRLLLEGGAGLNGSFFAAGLVDELSLLITPALDARVSADRVIEYGDAGLAGSCELSLTSCETVGHGVLHLRYKVETAT